MNDEKNNKFEDATDPDVDTFNYQKYNKTPLNAWLNAVVFYILPNLIIVGYFSYVTYHYVEITSKLICDLYLEEICRFLSFIYREDMCRRLRLKIMFSVWNAVTGPWCSLCRNLLFQNHQAILRNTIVQLDHATDCTVLQATFFRKVRGFTCSQCWNISNLNGRFNEFVSSVSKAILVVLLLAILVGYSVFETKNDFSRLRALGGIAVFIAIGFSISGTIELFEINRNRHLKLNFHL